MPWNRSTPGYVPPRTGEPDPVIEAYKKDADRTLLRENLKLSVEERIMQLMKLQQLHEELVAAGKRARWPA